MPTTALPLTRRPPAAAPHGGAAPGHSSNGPAYGLFLLVHATLFLRPAEIIPDVRGWNIFLALSLLCLVVALPDVLRQFTSRALEQRPLTFCVLGLLIAAALSHIVHFRFEEAFDSGVDFAKVVVYYLLLVSLVDSPRRVRSFIFWTLIFTAGVALLSALDFNKIIEVPKIRKRTVYGALNIPLGRMEGTGLFQDPNELCAVLAVGVIFCLYFLSEKASSSLRFLWLLPLGLFGYCIVCTQSRGGLLALLAGLGAICWLKVGLSRTVLLGALVGPAVLLLIGGRQAELTTSADTGQERIHLWSHALELFRTSPVFGIGVDEFAKVGANLVAHNSYLHGFTEMGVFGGLFFVGAVYFPLAALYRLRTGEHRIIDDSMRHLHPYLFGALAAYATGMMSLTVLYLMPPYAILGLGTAFLAVAATRPPAPPEKIDLRLIVKLLAASAVFLLSIQLFVRLFRG